LASAAALAGVKARVQHVGQIGLQFDGNFAPLIDEKPKPLDANKGQTSFQGTLNVAEI